VLGKKGYVVVVVVVVVVMYRPCGRGIFVMFPALSADNIFFATVPEHVFH